MSQTHKTPGTDSKHKIPVPQTPGKSAPVPLDPGVLGQIGGGTSAPRKGW